MQTCSELMKASDPSAEKNTHNLNCVHTLWGPTPPIDSTSYRWLLSQVPLVIQDVSETYQLRCQIEAAHLNTPRKHLLLAAASTSMAAVLGGWGCRAGQRFQENIREGGPMVLDPG